MMRRFYKKGFVLVEDWPEILGFALLVVGLLLGLFSTSAVINYVIIFLCGTILGRVWYRFKHEEKVPIFLITVGFLIGYLLGTLYGNRKVIILFYFLGIFLSYYLHEKKIIHSTEA